MWAKETNMSPRENIALIEIPSYSRKEELFNSISHMLGLPVAFFILLRAISLFISNQISLFYLAGLIIFAMSACAVYLVSSIYHYLGNDSFYKRLFRIIDHCTIYLLIAGTYTPICFVLSQTNVIGIIMLVVEWVGALLGIILNAFFFKHKTARVISFILYVLMGWLAVYSGGFLYLSKMCFTFILLGGVVYTIGSVLYAIGHKNTLFHSVFHVFVLISTIIQTIGVFYLF